MDIRKLKEVLSIPSYYGYEDTIRDYLLDHAESKGFDYDVDHKGNVYIIKGGLENNIPCVVSHMDTVYNEQIDCVKNNTTIPILEEEVINHQTDMIDIKLYSDITGIGGDDKCGVFICLELLDKLDNIMVVFFVEEEYGCHGSSNSNSEYLNNAGYIIEFDAPSNNWLSEYTMGVKLYNDNIFENIIDILNDYGVDNISKDPYTDVMFLRVKYNVCCLNFFAGYHNPHSGKNEYVLVSDVEKAINLGSDIIKKLGNKRFNYVL